MFDVFVVLYVLMCIVLYNQQNLLVSVFAWTIV